MKSISSIVARNMRVISRSKLSTFLVILAPLLIVFLIGSAFNSTSLTELKIGTYSQEYNELSESIISDFQNASFQTEKLQTKEECTEKIKQGTFHACVVFPQKISLESNESIKVHVDNSRINLAYLLINKIDTKISERSSEIGVGLVTEILDVLKKTSESLPAQKSKVENAASNLNSIKSEADTLTENSDLSVSIENLDEALDILEDSNCSSTNELKQKLTSIKQTLQASNENLDADITAINTNAESGKSSLNLASSELSQLITELSKINSKNAENLVVPIETEVSPISGDATNWKHLFPTLIALILLLSGVILASSLVLEERRARANFRNFMTPTSDISFVLGTYLTGLIIMTVQMIILLTGTFYLTGLNFINSLGGIAITFFLASSVFLFIGMFIGYAFKSDETTILSSISFAALLIFFSNTIIPVESIKGYFKYIAYYNPLFLADSLLKRTILFSESLNTLIEPILTLAGTLLIFLILTIIARKFTKRLV